MIRILLALFLCFPLSALAADSHSQVPNECEAFALERGLEGYNEAHLMLDLLAEDLDAALISDALIMDRGTCSAPKKTGGCLTCADKATCKSQCCQDHFTGREKAGCLRGCDNHWPNQ